MQHNNVLMVHGWEHPDYGQMKCALEQYLGCSVRVFALPYSGTKESAVTDTMADYLTVLIKQEMQSTSYDLAIGYGIGANLLVQAVKRLKSNTRLILVSPVHHDTALILSNKQLRYATRIVTNLLQRNLKEVSTMPINCTSLLPISKWQTEIKQLVSDMRRNNVHVVEQCVRDKYRVIRVADNILLVSKVNDQCSSSRRLSLFLTDFSSCHVSVVRDVGRIAQLETYDELLTMILSEVENG